MIGNYPRIEYSDNHGLISSCDRPTGDSLDICSRRASTLAYILQVPFIAKVGITHSSWHTSFNITYLSNAVVFDLGNTTSYLYAIPNLLELLDGKIPKICAEHAPSRYPAAHPSTLIQGLLNCLLLSTGNCSVPID
jgi:hypothetical protein